MSPTRTAASTRILVCDELEDVALETFRARGFEPELRPGMSEDALVAVAAEGVQALVVRSATKVTRRVIEAAQGLCVIGRAGVGVDNVDLEAATERGIVVMNTPSGNTTTTGELAVALILALARHVPRADASVRAGKWSKKGLVGTELTGKRLGVIGLGRIGRVVAERGLGLRMEVVAHDPYLAGAAASPVKGVELCGLDELLATSDFVTLHVPLLDSTRDLISRERIARMKPGARLVNAARGGLVDERAVADALDSGQLAGAAFDVLAEEPPPPGHPLVGRDDVIVTPHLGASSAEAQLSVASEIARQVCDFLESGVAHNAVNAPAVSAGVLEEIAPYVLLAEKAGRFLAQRMERPIRKLEVTLCGDVAHKASEYLALSVLVGALRATDEGVNYVNAPVVARERGIRLLEGEEEGAQFFQGMVKVRATSRAGEESHLVAGTVFGRAPRFVRIDELFLDLDPSGAILITEHHDRPGVMGRIGTLLGEARVNIRRVELGAPEAKPDKKLARGALASGFFSLDEVPPRAVLDAIAAFEPVREVRLVRL